MIRKHLGGCAAATAYRIGGYRIDTHLAGGSTHGEPIGGGETGMRAYPVCYWGIGREDVICLAASVTIGGKPAEGLVSAISSITSIFSLPG
jgi:hypothetical protein